MEGAAHKTLPRAGGVVLGEVTTVLLDKHVPLTPAQTAKSLALVLGRPVDIRQHPMPRAASADVVVGVDCPLVHGAYGTVRGIGTVTGRAVLVGGHIVQGSARAKVLIDGSGARRGWGHYTARPGVVEIVDTALPGKLIDGFLAADPSGRRSDHRQLDLGAVGVQLLDRVDGGDRRDGGTQLKSRRTTLRWAVSVTGGMAPPTADFVPGPDGAWWIRLAACPEDLEAVAEFCEDVALHLWLLNALDTACDRSLRNEAAVPELKPALSYLVHLWLPGAHLRPEVRGLWQRLEAVAGLDREWTVLVSRVRDRIMAS
jgi:hypothetical protein